MFFKKRKIIKPVKQESIFETWATTKNVEGFMSLIDKLPNPDIVLKKAGKNISVLRTIINHYQVGTCIDSRKAGTKSAKWDLAKNDCSDNQLKFYKDIFKNLDISKLIDDVLDTPLYGYNPIEIAWEKQGSYIVPVSLTAKPQEWFYFNSDNEFFFKDRFRGGKRQIDLENGYKFLLPRNKASFTNPYGQGILSRCFWMVVFINGGMEFWVKFCEKYGMPFMVGKYDRSMTDGEKQGLLKGLVNMVADAVGVIPNDGSIETINPASSTNSDIYERLVLKCENNIAKSILGQTLTTDVGSSGSYAAGQVHASVREDIVNSDKELVKTTVDKLIKMINEINFQDDCVPEFEFQEQEELGLLKAQRDNEVKNLGVKFSKNYIIRTYGYEEDDVEMAEVAQDFSESSLRASAGARADALSISEALRQGEAAANHFNDVIEPISNNPINSNINEIIDFFNQTHDSEAALSKLEDLYPKLNSDELEKILTKIIFIAELKGRMDVQNAHK